MSDSLKCRGKWGTKQYPICPGHEVIGRISKLGKDVKQLKLNDLVGFGP